MIVAICFFLLGAGFGLFLAIRHFMRRTMSGWVAVAHGAAGATGFAILMFWCIREPGFSTARYALGILVGAIALGCVNVVYHIRRLRHRSALIVAHALAALTGVGTLTYAAFVHANAIASEAPVAAEALAHEESPSSSGPLAPASAAPTAPAPTASAPNPESRPSEPSHASRAPGFAWTERAVRFPKDGTAPDESSSRDIAAIADALKADPSVTLVEVQGHSDERGGEAQNLELTRARARAVTDALVERGVAPSRLRSVGFAARCPFDKSCERAGAPDACHGETEWQKDRRVTFLVLDVSGRRFQGSVACGRAADLISGDDATYNKTSSNEK